MKRNKVVICVIALLIGTVMLFANGSKEQTNTVNVDNKESQKKIQLLLTYPKEKAVLYQCLDDFSKESGIELEILYMPLEESRKQISIMVASNSLPDVMDVDNPDTATYAQMGILADISNKVNADIDTAKYYQGSLNQSVYEGKYYGLPFTTNNLCMYYNKDLFEKAGIEKAPETWAEVLEACQKLSAIGVYGFSVAGGQTTDTTFQMWPFLWGSGVDYKNIESKSTIDCLNFYKSLVDNQYMSKEVVNYNAGDNANQFIAGKVAMIIDGPWRLNSIKKGATFDYEIVKVPSGPAGFNTVLGGHNFVITNGKNIDAAWEFVKYMNRPDVMLKYSEAENYIPARKDVCDSSEYFKSAPIHTFVEMAEYAHAMPTKNYNKISDALIEMFQSVVLGAKSPEVAAKDAKSVIDTLI